MEDLEQRIAARLNEALERQQAAGFESIAEAGLAVADRGEDGFGRSGVIRLSVKDVARIAAEEARH